MPEPGDWPAGPFLAALLEGLADGVVLVGRDRRIVAWNRAAATMTGYAPGEVVGRTCEGGPLGLSEPRGCRICGGDCLVERALSGRTGELYAEVVTVGRGDEGRVDLDVRGSPVLDASGGAIGAVVILRGVAHSTPPDAALSDPLTGLGNRRALDGQFAVRTGARSGADRPLSAVMLDLDGFKRINDTGGHPAGDAVLRAVGEVLRRGCRGADFVARYGGDEFLVLVDGDREAAARVAGRLRGSLAAVRTPGGAGLTASFGVAEATPGEAPEGLVARADAALYRAKALGGDRVEVAAE